MTKQFHSFKRRGFTLIEVMIASIILMITMAAVATVMHTATRSWRAGHGVSEIFQTARIAQDVIARDLDNLLYQNESDYNRTFRNQLDSLANEYVSDTQKEGDNRWRERHRDSRHPASARIVSLLRTRVRCLRAASRRV